FWTSAGIAASTLGAGIGDPRIAYDAPSGRWFASQITKDNTGNTVLVGRSNTSDTTAGWQATSVVGSASGKFLDFDTLGVSGDAVVIGGDMFTSLSGGSHSGESLFAIPKADLLAASPTVSGMTRFDDFLGTGGIQVVHAASG